jgi:hypothetical protein
VRWFLAVIFAVLAASLWWYIYHAVTSGVVQRPRGNAWWRDPCHYECDVTPVRFWGSVVVYVILAGLSVAAGIQCLVLR